VSGSNFRFAGYSEVSSHTLTNRLEDDPTSTNTRGRSLRLFLTDAEKLLNAFREQLQIMHDLLRPAKLTLMH
jgi:hypothetical protein